MFRARHDVKVAVGFNGEHFDGRRIDDLVAASGDHEAGDAELGGVTVDEAHRAERGGNPSEGRLAHAQARRVLEEGRPAFVAVFVGRQLIIREWHRQAAALFLERQAAA